MTSLHDEDDDSSTTDNYSPETQEDEHFFKLELWDRKNIDIFTEHGCVKWWIAGNPPRKKEIYGDLLRTIMDSNTFDYELFSTLILELDVDAEAALRMCLDA